VVQGQPALTTQIPKPAKAGAVVVTPRHREESCSAAVHRQQERHGPAQKERAPSGAVPIATRKRASKCAPEKHLAIEPGPIAAAGRRAGAGGLMGVTTDPTPRKWCPLHEMSLHDVMACRHIGHLVEIHR
jgi:hypothetical protein